MGSLRDTLRAALGGLPAAFWTLLAGLFVNRLASFVAIFLALYLTRERGLPPNEAGRIVALFGVGIVARRPTASASVPPSGPATRMPTPKSATIRPASFGGSPRSRVR